MTPCEEARYQAKKIVRLTKQTCGALAIPRFRNKSAQNIPAEEVQLKHALQSVARTLGFDGWSELKHLLEKAPEKSGSGNPAPDFGHLFHTARCDVLLNHWCRDYEEALTTLARYPHMHLVPYRQQFVVVEEAYMKAIGVSVEHIVPGSDWYQGTSEDWWNKAVSGLIRARCSAFSEHLFSKASQH